MCKTVINVDGVSKRYRLGSKERKAITLAGKISNFFKSPWDNFNRLSNLNHFELNDESVYWALKDISFEVQEGQVLGIIGKNGAGKSTLLKILSQITEPTFGKIEIHGRVASLLEVGTGFHPDLSGRENIYMNGTILGMTRREIDSKLDEIIDFSGVEKFIDTPVKFYSSGMKVRLGFSVAAHLDPEILIIDEVLAVGDFEFQKKCLGKMEDVSRNQGRTVLFVSHNLQAVSTLTSRVLLLEFGENKFLGSTDDGISSYLKSGQINNTTYLGDPSSGISMVVLKTSEPNQVHRFGHDFHVEITVRLGDSIKNPAISYQIFDEYENPIIHELFIASEVNYQPIRSELIIVSKIPNLKLYPGSYSLKVHFADNATKTKIDTTSNICGFNVVVMGELRDYYWQQGAAKYVVEGTWRIV